MLSWVGIYKLWLKQKNLKKNNTKKCSSPSLCKIFPDSPKIKIESNDGIIFYEATFNKNFDKSLYDMDSFFESLNKLSDRVDSVNNGNEYLIFGIIQKDTEVV